MMAGHNQLREGPMRIFTCPHCGHTTGIADDADARRFCPWCGTPVEPDNSPPEGGRQPPPAPSEMRGSGDEPPEDDLLR